MYFNKIHHPSNFSFADKCIRSRSGSTVRIGRRSFRLSAAALGEDVFKVTYSNSQWEQRSQAELSEEFSSAGATSMGISDDGGLCLSNRRGDILLRTQPGQAFGVCGQAWMLRLEHRGNMQFYGMGEKNIGFELSGKRTKFWNTDLWADFNGHQIVHESTDPMYLSIPWLIIKQENTYVGLLINNPYAVFMATAPNLRIADQMNADAQPDSEFYVGSPDGLPEIYFIVGPSLEELLQKLQRLCGKTPRPPLWALGYHQCRWGYRSYDCLDKLQKAFEKHRIPFDGLWLDIDYMDGFRVFTFNKDCFPRPAEQIGEISKRGCKVVPIIDPGVKVESGYEVYESGLADRVFCLNSENRPYTGFVWPGATAFPDFSMPSARKWWAELVKKFAESGIGGAWLDMNDPSTGASELDEMRFQRGGLDHAAYHNQYALGMAKASRDGFLRANPELRPFLISRSGFIGTSRYAAIWTGDNFSNEHHLRQSIPVTLNLAMSGVPFNGPDVCGFMGDTTPELAKAWYKAGFLFPFFRNHTAIGTRDQEPWAFGPAVMRVLRRYIRLRYKLMPYIYNLFIEQEKSGRAIMRPLFHDFADTPRLPLARIADQFLMGPCLMHAPILSASDTQRKVALPDANWFDAGNGQWIKGGKTISTKPAADGTPIYIRDGSIIPMRREEPEDNRTDLTEVDFHIFLSPRFKGEAETHYTADDGASFDYRKGMVTTFTIRARAARNRLELTIDKVCARYKPCRVRFISYRKFQDVVLTVQNSSRRCKTTADSWTFAGKGLKTFVTPEIVIG